MYQFMVATRSDTNVRAGNPTWTGPGTGVGDIPTMGLTSGSNKWASRAVVALQLAAWSAVGIVLLEKGVSSLQKRPHSFNVSHEITVSTEPTLEESTRIGNLSPDEPELGTGLFSVIPLDHEDDTKSSRNSDINEIRTTSRAEDKRNFVNKNRILPEKDNELTSRTDEKKENLDPEEIKTTTTKTIEETDEGSPWKNRKRSRFAKVGSGGAAAAVAMVAVGAVMLVLGPAVIVLRALDERRQERRFLKLSGEEDLPPSYEQATGDDDQAPTYSSLNLDTLVVPLQSSESSGNNSMRSS